MSSFNKGGWSVGAVLGNGTGGALGAALAAIATVSIGPVAIPVLVGITAAGGFAGSALGNVIGHWWDQPPEKAQEFRSAALYTTVISGFLGVLFGSLASGRMTAQPELTLRGLFATSAVLGFLASMSRSLIDDLRAAFKREVYR